MGLRYRRRTKGKNGWLNFSWSDKTGLSTSVSAKVVPFTWNSGNGKTTRKRITTNIGGGLSHVSYVKTPKPVSNYTYHNTPGKSSSGFWIIIGLVWCVIILLAIIGQ